MQMVDHLFIDVTLLKRPIVYLESGRPLQTTTAEGVDMAVSMVFGFGNLRRTAYQCIIGQFNSFKENSALYLTINTHFV